MGELFDRCDVAPEKGTDIMIGAGLEDIFVSERET